MLKNILSKIKQVSQGKGKWVAILGVALIISLIATAFPMHIGIENNADNTIFQIGQGKYTITIGNIVSAETSDYTCDGVEDNVQFQEAMDALPDIGGQLLVLAGNYIWDDATTVTRAIDNVSIVGVGASVSFAGDNSTALFTAGGNNWLFSNFQADTGGLEMGATSNWMWVGVIINGQLYTNYAPTAGIGAVFDLEAPTGRTATYVVAASDASALSKSQADYVCDGTDDQVEIQAAIDALPANRGKIHLSQGTYSINASIILLPYELGQQSVMIEGEGRQTILRLADNANCDMITQDVWTSVYPGQAAVMRFQIHDLRIEGNRDNNTLGSAIKLLGWNCLIENVEIYHMAEDGIHFVRTSSEYSSANWIVNCLMYSPGNSDSEKNGGYGIIYEGGDGFLFGNNIGRTLKAAIFLHGSVITAIGNHVYACEYGFEFVGHKMHILGNEIEYIQKHGIYGYPDEYRSIRYTQIESNIIQGVSQAETGTYDGIRIEGTAIYLDPDYSIITNNIISRHISLNTTVFPRYGISLGGSSLDNVEIVNNIIRDWVTAAIYRDAGTNIMIRSNLGYVTENSGTATVLNTATSIVVSHGLATTPARVQITPRENPTNAVSFWWVDTLTTTQFTIHVNADPGASNLDFDWRAVIGEGS